MKMDIRPSPLQLALTVATPLTAAVLCWTISVFHRSRSQWRPLDIVLVAILTQGILRQIATSSHVVLSVVRPPGHVELCSAVTWLFHGVHTLQAASLTTLAVVGLVTGRGGMRLAVSKSHVVYHMLCLAVLSASVGVAAIVAKREAPGAHLAPVSTHNSAEFEFDSDADRRWPHGFTCRVLPYDLDIKYSVFVLSLHALLALVSLVSVLVFAVQAVACGKRSSVHIRVPHSQLTMSSQGSQTSSEADNAVHRYYDKPVLSRTYLPGTLDHSTLTKSVSSQTSLTQAVAWSSDCSNLSTDSRVPCLDKEAKTVTPAPIVALPVLMLCYIVHHIPLLVLCIAPWLVPSSWPPPEVSWVLALTQDAALPAVLALCHGRFAHWVSRLYSSHQTALTLESEQSHQQPAHLLADGLAGKFTHITTSPAADMCPSRDQPPASGAVLSLRSRSHSHDRGLDKEVLYEQDDTYSRHVDDRTYYKMAYRTSHGTVSKFPITNGSLYGRLPIIHNYRRQKGVRAPIHSISMGLHSANLQTQDIGVFQEPLWFQSEMAPTFTHVPYPDTQPWDNSFSSLPSEYQNSGRLPKHEKSLKDSFPNACKRSSYDSEAGACSKTPARAGSLLSRSSNCPDSLVLDNKGDKYESESSDNESALGLIDQPFNDDSVSCTSITTEANEDFEFYPKRENILQNGKVPNLRKPISFPPSQMTNMRACVPEKARNAMSMESLTASLNQPGLSYLDSGDLCSHNYHGSTPDFKKIFVSDYI